MPAAGKRGGAELAVVTERVAGHDERGAFAAAFQVQPERFRELLTVVTADPAAQPVRFGLVQIGGVHDRVVDQAAAHPPGGVRLGFDLAKPGDRVGGHVGGARVRDDMQQARVVDCQQYRRLVVVQVALCIAVDLLNDAAVIEQSSAPARSRGVR